jgi:hypothetical protein
VPRLVLDKVEIGDRNRQRLHVRKLYPKPVALSGEHFGGPSGLAMPRKDHSCGKGHPLRSGGGNFCFQGSSYSQDGLLGLLTRFNFPDLSY